MYPISCSWPAWVTQALGLALGLALVPPGNGARAADVRVGGAFIGVPYPEAGTAFDLHLAREDLAVDYADDSGGGDLELGRLGVSFHERLAPGTRMGIRLGGAGLDQADRSQTAGLDLDGYYGELAFAGALSATDGVGLDLRASLRYTAVRHENDSDERTEIEWLTFDVRPALRLTPSDAVSVRIGPSATAVDGSEDVDAPAAATTPFNADGRIGAFAAVDLYTGDGGVVTLRGHGGNPAGVYVRFERRY